MEWLYDLERGEFAHDPLAAALSGCSSSERKKILSVMAYRRDFSKNAVAEHLRLERKTVRRHLAAFDAGGIGALAGKKGEAPQGGRRGFRGSPYSVCCTSLPRFRGLTERRGG